MLVTRDERESFAIVKEGLVVTGTTARAGRPHNNLR